MVDCTCCQIHASKQHLEVMQLHQSTPIPYKQKTPSQLHHSPLSLTALAVAALRLPSSEESPREITWVQKSSFLGPENWNGMGSTVV